MKNIKTVIERNEKVNECGVKVVNELVRLDKVCSDGSIAKGYTEYVWYEEVGEDDIKHIKISYKTESRMRKAMVEFGF